MNPPEVESNNKYARPSDETIFISKSDVGSLYILNLTWPQSCWQSGTRVWKGSYRRVFNQLAVFLYHNMNKQLMPARIQLVTCNIANPTRTLQPPDKFPGLMIPRMPLFLSNNVIASAETILRTSERHASHRSKTIRSSLSRPWTRSSKCCRNIHYSS